MRAIRITVKALLVLVAVVAGYAGYAGWRYRRVPGTVHPCIDCTTPVRVRGYDLYYRELGTDSTRPPVVLVHGGPGHSSLSFKHGFDFVAATRRLVMYDQRGSGNSQGRNRPADFTVDSLVEELESLRHAVIRADRIVLVGHSFGSAIVQRYALKYPAHVDRLAIIGGVRLNNEVSSPLLWRTLGPMFGSFALGFPPADGAAADAWFTGLPSGDRLHDPRRTDLLQDVGITRFATWREVSMSAVGPPREEELRHLDVPVTFMYGASDAPYTGKPVAEYLCGLVPRCRIVAFGKSGHWPFLEEPEAFQELFTQFLDAPAR